MWRISRAASVAGALWIMGSVVEAQIATGSITGTVSDKSGGVLPEVEVFLTGERLISGSETRKTDAMGAYRFDRLPPGSYDLKFELPGFNSLERKGIRVDAAFTATIKVQLEVGELAESVTVVGASPTVDMKSTVQQTVMGQEILEEIPTGRDPYAVAKLVPGVQVDRYDVGGTQGMQQSEMSAHGSTTKDKTFAVDGLNTNFTGGPGGWILMYYDQGLFEQITYQTSAIPAEVLVGGVYVNMVTKEAGNRWGGNLRLHYANDDLQAENHATPELARFDFPGGNPVERQYDFNASVGGPLVSNKLWFRGTYRDWSVNKLQLGARNPDGSLAIDDNRFRSYTGKLTWQVATRHKLNYLFSLNHRIQFHRREPGGPTFVEDRATSKEVQIPRLGQIRYTATLTDRAIFESALSAMWGGGGFEYQEGVQPTDIRIEDPVRNTASVAGPFSSDSGPFTRIQFDNTFTYAKSGWGGSHNFKTGIQFARLAFGGTREVNGDLHRILNDGVPTAVRVWNTPTDSESQVQQLGFFAQDSWTIGSRLTLNLGGRLDLAEGWIPEFSLPPGRFVGERQFERRDVLDQKIGVWRTGLVYDVLGDGKLALKASHSRYAHQVGAGLVDVLSPLRPSAALRSWTDFNGDLVPQDNELGPSAGFVETSIRYADPKGPAWSYSDEISAGVEYELMRDFRVGAMYYHRTNRRLIARRNLAIPPTAYTQHMIAIPNDPMGPGGTTLFYNLDPALFGRQDNVLDNDPLLDTTYNGVEFTASKRLSDRWQFLAGLTLGKNEGGIAPAFSQPDLNDPNNLINQQGIVGEDSKYSLKVAGSYQAPGNLMVSLALLYNDGYPYGGTYTPSGSIYTITRDVFPELTVPSQRILVTRRGEERLPDVLLIDLRLSRPIRLGKERKITPLLEIFNLTNASTVLGVNPVVGSRWLFPREILSPRMFRVGFSFDF